MSEERLEEIERELVKLDRIERKLAKAEQKLGNLRFKDLAGLATKLGRTERKSRSKHRIFESLNPNAPELPIPHHTKAFGKGLAKKIISTLYDDVFWEREKLEEERNFLLNQKNDVDHRRQYDG